MSANNKQDFMRIESRLKEIFNLRFDYEVAKLLGLKQTTYATSKSREVIPFLPIIDLCNRENIDMNYIFKGTE